MQPRLTLASVYHFMGFWCNFKIDTQIHEHKLWCDVMYKMKMKMLKGLGAVIKTYKVLYDTTLYDYYMSVNQSKCACM